MDMREEHMMHASGMLQLSPHYVVVNAFIVCAKSSNNSF